MTGSDLHKLRHELISTYVGWALVTFAYRIDMPLDLQM